MKNKNIQLYLGDSKEILKQLPDNSIDSVVTDPPYELGFMGKSWDATGIAYNVKLWKECLRVLKPGGHLLSFGGSRTYHRMACAIEDAGFEIRDQIMWVYGSGFPKSLNIGKAIDKLQGSKRKLVGKKSHAKKDFKDNLYAQDPANRNNKKVFGYGEEILTKGNSEWEGWGTALKPAHEPIVLARKPLSEKTVAKNVLKWGVGGLAIDNCRVHKQDGDRTEYGVNGIKRKTGNVFGKQYGEIEFDGTQGRFPANFIHDGSDEVVDLFPNTKSTQSNRGNINPGKMAGGSGQIGGTDTIRGHNDSGSASRFFYCAKASKKERNMGCEGLPVKQTTGGGGMNDPQGDDVCGKYGSVKSPARNNHPTVKPIALMKYLITLITRKGQTVLDPFMGSGTTGIACKLLNRKFIGIEMSEEYIKIAQARIKGWNIKEEER